MINALIVDDEILAAKALKLMIERYLPNNFDLEIQTDFHKAIDHINSTHPSLIFLDVMMPPYTGFELLQKIDLTDKEIIFTTAFDNFAVQAFKFSALDYLLKPIVQQELVAAVQKYLTKVEIENERKLRYENFLQNIHRKDKKDAKLAIPTQEKTHFLGVENIIRCEAESNYTWIYLRDKSKLLAAKTLKEFETLLAEYGFLRLHRSHLVNREEIDHMKSHTEIHLKDGSILPIARLRKKDVLNELH
ncbi:MAG: LytTR family DNA-binding domain-containing protein [Saprospiraceae bacterium]